MEKNQCFHIFGVCGEKKKNTHTQTKNIQWLKEFKKKKNISLFKLISSPQLWDEIRNKATILKVGTMLLNLWLLQDSHLIEINSACDHILYRCLLCVTKMLGYSSFTSYLQ